MKRTPILLAAATLLAASSASAATLINSDFESGSGTWAAYNPNTSAILGAISIATDSTLGGSNALVWTPGSNGSSIGAGISALFANTVLAQGDSLTLSLKFHFTAVPTTGGSYLRLALGTDAGGAADTGLRVAYNTSGTTGLVLYDIGTGTPGGLLAGNVSSPSPTMTGGTTPAITSTGLNTLGFSINRTATGYDVAYTLNGANTVTATYTSASDITFNKLVLGENNATQTGFAIDDVQLTTTAVPEPSTYGLMGAGALAAVAFVRRRRKHAVAA